MGLPPLPDPCDHYRAILLRHFERNRTTSINPDGIFFYGFNDGDIKDLSEAVPTALTQLARPFILINCAGKTDRQIYLEGAKACGKEVPDHAAAYVAAEALYSALLEGAMTLVLVSLSHSKGSHKPGLARGLKLLDDAHIRNIRAMSDVIFVDRASFLEKAWDQIGVYLRLVPPLNVSEAWSDRIASGRGPTLVPMS